MAISIRKVVKESLKFNVVSAISLLIRVPNQLIIGMFLIPEEYGIISFVALWKLYAGLVNPGMLSGAQREIPYLIGKNNRLQSLKVQNISISSDLLYSAFPFSVILCGSFFYSNELIRIGLILTAISFLSGRFVNYWATINFIKQNFTVVAIGKLIGSILSPVIIIISIYWLGVYAVLMAPLICTIFTGFYYLRKGPIGYHFQFEWAEVIRLVKVGFVFSLSGVIFYVYRMADRTIIASLLPLHDLGLFTFAMGFIMVAINFFTDFGRVLEPILWEHSAKASAKDSFNTTKRMAIYLALATAISIPIAQLGYDVIVTLLVPAYIESIPLFLILSNMLYLSSLAMIPAVILNSIVVNKQAFVTGIYAIGAGINIVLDLFIIHAGYGIGAIGLVTVISQGITTSVLYFVARKYMIKQGNKFAVFLGRIALPFIISILFSVFHGFFFGSTILSPWFVGTVSILCQVLLWSLIISLFYRGYVTREKIAGAMKEMWRLATTRIKEKRLHSQ
jgi:O-antigen/teichoic acid export membrane protein